MSDVPRRNKRTGLLCLEKGGIRPVIHPPPADGYVRFVMIDRRGPQQRPDRLIGWGTFENVGAAKDAAERWLGPTGTVRARAELGLPSGPGGSVGRSRSKSMTSVQSAPDVSAQNPARPQPINPIVVIGAIGLAAEVMLPWALIWLSDTFFFDVPSWSQWVVFGGPPALSLLAAFVYRASRAWSLMALRMGNEVSPKGTHS
jgi:hypothetical protein